MEVQESEGESTEVSALAASTNTEKQTVGSISLDVTDTITQMYGIPAGVFIGDVREGSPAEKTISLTLDRASNVRG